MTYEEAIEWLTSIAEKYIHGGDSRFDARRLGAINTAIEALEKRIRKKPYVEFGFFCCKSCGHELNEEDDSCCHNCGQAIDWSET